MGGQQNPQCRGLMDQYQEQMYKKQEKQEWTDITTEEIVP